MGISGIGWERHGNAMGAALGKRWEVLLGPEVVAQWDAGVHYFVWVELDEMRNGRGRVKGARERPGGHPRNWCRGHS